MEKITKGKMTFRCIVLSIICVLLICPVFSQSFAKTSYTKPNEINGYSYSSTYGAKLDNVLKGTVSVLSSTDTKDKYKYPIGTSLNKSYEYTITGTTVRGSQCYIYAQAVYYYLFGDIVFHGDGLSGYWKNSNKVLSNLGSASYDTFRNAGVGFGTYIRTTSKPDGTYYGKAGHSMIVLGYNASGITILEGNADSNGLVRAAYFTWNEFNYEYLTRKGYRISHVVQYKGNAPTVPALDNRISLTSSFPTAGIVAGTAFKLTGTATSNYNVASVTATIKGNGISQVFDSGSMQKASYDLSNLNQKLKIENLTPGTYTLTIKMLNVGTSSVASTLLTKTWTFKILPALDNKINLTSAFPSAGIVEGTAFKISGTVSSNYNVRSVTATIKGNGISQVFDSGSMQKASYDLSNLNQKLKIENLTPGTYTLTIKMFNVGTSSVASTLLTKTWTFKVVHILEFNPVTPAPTPGTGGSIGDITATPGTGESGGTVIPTPTPPLEKATIGKVKLSTASYVYNGKVKSPKVIVKDSKGNILKKNVAYTVTTPKGRNAIGKYTYTIKFKGDFAGTKAKKLTLTIKPKTPTITAPKAVKKAVTVKWKKGKKAQVTGYQVMVATNKKFTKGKNTVNVKGYKVTSKKVTKLKAKTKYFVKVRTYKTVKGVKIYSNWSQVKSIRTK